MGSILSSELLPNICCTTGLENFDVLCIWDKDCNVLINALNLIPRPKAPLEQLFLHLALSQLYSNAKAHS
jgi:hypothetical protein